MAAPESAIRDRLAINLQILEPGLSLLDIEKYLPNPQGTRGFVDILARDSLGRYVLIELKRSDASSRQAIHEVLKYVEGVKVSLAVKEDELRVFIVSTEWGELLVPFSSFVQRVSISTRGFSITVDELGTPLSANMVNPLSIREDRLFSQWHEISYYRSTESLKKGIRTHQDNRKRKGILNYVLVVLEAHPDYRSRELHAIMKSLNAFRDEQVTLKDVEKMRPCHTHMLYFGMLLLDPLDCLERIKQQPADYPGDLEEFLSDVQEMEGEERDATLQEKLLEMGSLPHRDYFDIGYPAKFGTKILDDEKWRITDILRYGTVKSNALLQDSTIVAELRGEQGVTGQRYIKEIQGAEVSQINVIREELKRCLADNPIWSSHLQSALATISDYSASAQTRISVFNPSNALLTIYLSLARKDGERYIPNYYVKTIDGNVTQLIFGVYGGTGQSPSMSRIVNDHYDGEPSAVLFPLNWGGYQEYDRFVARDAGLTYRTYKCIDADGQREFFELTALGWESCEPLSLFDQYQSYLEQNRAFVKDILDFFSSHWDGSMTTFCNDEVISFNT